MDPKKWSNGIRQLVSKKKRRHKELGFDLDLSYITTRIIAMGFPSTGNEGIYRNHADHVTEFLRIKHGDKVKVYNLCSERDYPVSLFDGRVSKYPFDDHNPPPMQMFLPFCKDAKQWLDSDPENVIAVHCKAGKGRTGVMICAYLLYVGEWDNADECMAFYGFARTHNGKGVTIPSQIRFIRHFAELCHGVGEDIQSNAGSSIKYPGEVAAIAEKMKDGKVDIPSGSDDDTDRETTMVDNTEDSIDVPSSVDREHNPNDVGKDVADDGVTVEMNTGKAAKKRSIVVTTTGTFTDYSEDGSTNLEEKLNNARAAATSSKAGRRPTYAQASFWMSSHHETVHQILLDSGVPGGLLGADHNNDDLNDTVLALENVKSAPHTNEVTSSPEHVRERGEVLPPVVLAVVEMRLSSVPQLNIRGTFQPVFRIQGSGYNILSTDFLPQTVYRGKGPITFAIPGINVVDEVLFTLYNKTNFGKEKIASFWLHTAFVKNNRVVLTKPEIDKVKKDKRHKKYPSDFTIQISFDDVLFELEESNGHEEQKL